MCIPLILITMEFILSYEVHYMFAEYEDNVRGLALCISSSMFPLELIRFTCFVLLWVKFELEDGTQISDIVWSAIFSLIGEVYSHTSLWEILQNEMQIRLYGRRLDDFLMVYDNISSIRSYLEYVAPAVWTSNYMLFDWISNRIPILFWERHNHSTYTDANAIIIKKIWNILIAYYILELIAEAVCLGMNKMMLYNRRSIIGNLKWTTLLLMIVYAGMATDIPTLVSEFLRVVTIPGKSIGTFPPSEAPSV